LIESIKLPIAEPPLKSKIMTSPLRNEKNKDNKVDNQGLTQLPQPISNNHKQKKA
jgi:hypothetical protein